MTDALDYINNPDKLIELVQSVVEQLILNDNRQEKRLLEAQLREITKAIGNLERQDVLIPDVLRREKMRLATAVEVPSESYKSLTRLFTGLGEIHLKLKNYIEGEKSGPKRNGLKIDRVRAPQTGSKVLRKLIIEALRSLGGSAPKKEVHKFIERSMEGQFYPRDLEWRDSTRNYIWQNNTDWERFRMTQDGILKKNSPIGIWELTEEYR